MDNFHDFGNKKNLISICRPYLLTPLIFCGSHGFYLHDTLCSTQFIWLLNKRQSELCRGFLRLDNMLNLVVED